MTRAPYDDTSTPDSGQRSAPAATVGGGADVALRRGARWLTAGTLTVGGLNYAYALVLTHLLPTAVYARFAAGQALLLTAGTVAAVSVPWVLAKELMRVGGDTEQRRRAVWFATLANLAQGVVVGLAVGLVAASFSDVLTSCTVAVSAALMFVASTSLGWFQGQQRFEAIAARGVAEAVSKIAFGAGLVLLGAGAGGALAGFGIGALVIATAGTWVMRADYGPRTGSATSPDLLLSTRGVAGIQGLVSVLASIDVVLVAVLPVQPGAAASYQASMILARVPLFLAGAVAAVAFPMLGGPGASAAALLRSGSWLYLMLAVPLALVLATAPPDVLAALFPSGYDQVGALLPYTATAGVLIGFVELLTTFFQAEGHYAISIRRQLLGVVAGLVAIPVGWQLGGVRGIAAGACTGAAITVLLLLLPAARLWPGRRLPLRTWLACWAAFGLVLMVLRATPVLWLVLASVVLGACAYSVFLRPGRAAAVADPT